jgi:hypothetical protein
MSAPVSVSFLGGIELKVTLFRDVVGLVALAASLGCCGVSADGPLYPAPAPVNPPGTPPPQPPVTFGSPPPFPVISDAVAIYTGPERLYDVLIESHGSSLPTRYVFFAHACVEAIMRLNG